MCVYMHVHYTIVYIHVCIILCVCIVHISACTVQMRDVTPKKSKKRGLESEHRILSCRDYTNVHHHPFIYVYIYTCTHAHMWMSVMDMCV